MPLPPHFFVWLLLMVSDGNARPVDGFRTEQGCKQTARELNAKASRSVRFRCDKQVIEKL